MDIMRYMKRDFEFLQKRVEYDMDKFRLLTHFFPKFFLRWK